MSEKEILDSIKQSMDQAPVELLEKIKAESRPKMLKHDNITGQTRISPFQKRMSYASVAAVFIFMIFGWQFQTRMPDSRVYLDVNPSIEIVTNRQGEVINVTAKNIDGKKIAESLDFKKKTVYHVTEEILDNMMSENYLDEDQKYLLLSVYNKDQDKAEEQKEDLDARIHEHFEVKELRPIVLTQRIDNTSTIEKYAEEYGVSISKMTFIRNLIVLNPELETEDLVDLRIGELVRLSQGMGLELEKIIDTKDMDKIQYIPKPEAQPEMVTPEKPSNNDNGDDISGNQSSEIISADRARSIALSVANGRIIDFDFDDDDFEYKIDIEVGDLEYEITIDARTGAVLDIEIDD